MSEPKFIVKTSLMVDGAPKPTVSKYKQWQPKVPRSSGVTGPFITNEGWPFDIRKMMYRHLMSFRSLPRGSVQLPHTSRRVTALSRNGSRYGYLNAYTSTATELIAYGTIESQRARDIAHNAALSNLKGKIGKTFQLGENLGEAAKTFNMVADRLLQVGRSYKALRKGNFSAFCRELGIKPKRRDAHLVGSRKRVQKNSANLWLEYHYGWSPLINDVQKGIGELTDTPIWDRRILGSGKCVFSALDRSGAYETHSGYASLSTHLRCVVRVSDPNAYAANRLGLDNFVQTVWQLAPFSLLVDWFLNVEQYLGSLTEFAGLDLRYPVTSDKMAALSLDAVHDGYWDEHIEFAGFSLVRSLSLPSTVLVPPLWKGLGIERAASAISFVVTLFSGKGGNRLI